jgi:hypothetical protein
MDAYKDLSRLTSVAVWCVVVYMALELLYGAVLGYESFIAQTSADPTMAPLSLFVAVGVLLSMLVCIVVVGRWIYRASTNAHAISDEMTISPGWAVGSYFVPILNLFRPYQAMREIWLASNFRGNWHGEPSPGLLIAWWALWIGTNILGYVSMQMSMRSELGQPLDIVVPLDLITVALDVPLSLVLIALMRRTARAQGGAGYDEVFA